MTARVPGENRDIIEIQPVDDVLPSATVFVSSVEQDERLASS
jgi:hypothetical protein